MKSTVRLFAAVVGFALFPLSVALTGCGGASGGGSGAITASATGRAAFTLRWPEIPQTRLIPAAASSIVVEILRDGTPIATRILTRPDGGGTGAASFDNLPVGTLNVRASAYPQADGTGTAQATGSVGLDIRPGETTQFALTMDTTIDHVEVSPATLPPVTVGGQVNLSMTARDTPGTGGAVVLTHPANVAWTSSNASVVAVSASGTLTALSAGTVTVTVTEAESGKTASVMVVAVTPTLPGDPFPGVTEFLTLDLVNLPNYANPTFPIHYDAAVRNRDNTPANNPVTDRGATLGRVLFFDRRLSVNDTVSCASCHQPAVGMTDPRRFSLGFSGNEFTTAHSMRLGNIRYYAGLRMFWDRRANTLEAQATQPIQNAVEMGFDAAHGGLASLISKMQTLPYYPELFRWVYGDATITEDRIQRALAQFERSMVSVNSKFDTEFARVYDANDPQRGVGRPFAGFTAQEERGKQLFLRGPGQGGAGCATCHQVPTFALDPNSRSNGLDAGETTIFKSPSLKNVALTGPFMHDGRFQTLEQVVDHYIRGIQDGPALDNRLRGPNGQPQRLPLNNADRDDLVAFLRTLNDPVLVSDAKFTNPFKK